MQLNGRRIDSFGNVIFNRQGLYNLILNGESISGLMTDDAEIATRFNQNCRHFDHEEDAIQFYQASETSMVEFDKANQEIWLIPASYKEIDVLEYLYDKCTTVEEIERVQLEWELFRERDMEPVLRVLIYLVDNFRERGILWGVGRGSSVASYCLYLIGIHRINSIKYNLDPTEFLK